MGGNFDFTDVQASVPGLQAHPVRFVGGSAAVTKVSPTGPGLSVTYVSTGVVDIDFSGHANNPGVYVGLAGAPAFQATTPADVKSYVGVVGAYNSTTKKLRLSMYESGNLADLAALEWCSLVPLFKVA